MNIEQSRPLYSMLPGSAAFKAYTDPLSDSQVECSNMYMYDSGHFMSAQHHHNQQHQQQQHNHHMSTMVANENIHPTIASYETSFNTSSLQRYPNTYSHHLSDTEKIWEDASVLSTSSSIINEDLIKCQQQSSQLLAYGSRYPNNVVGNSNSPTMTLENNVNQQHHPAAGYPSAYYGHHHHHQQQQAQQSVHPNMYTSSSFQVPVTGSTRVQQQPQHVSISNGLMPPLVSRSLYMPPTPPSSEPGSPSNQQQQQQQQRNASLKGNNLPAEGVYQLGPESSQASTQSTSTNTTYNCVNGKHQQANLGQFAVSLQVSSISESTLHLNGTVSGTLDRQLQQQQQHSQEPAQCVPFCDEKSRLVSHTHSVPFVARTAATAAVSLSSTSARPATDPFNAVSVIAAATSVVHSRFNRRNNPELEKRRIHRCDFPG